MNDFPESFVWLIAALAFNIGFIAGLVVAKLRVRRTRMNISQANKGIPFSVE